MSPPYSKIAESLNYYMVAIQIFVVNSVWRLGDDNTTISKCDVLAVCLLSSYLPHTHVTSPSE